MEIKTLTGIDPEEILKVFNRSFSDYFIPLQLNEEQLVAKMQAEKVDLSLSVGVFENGELIAFILHGFDTINCERITYNAGTGVIPEQRGLGLTKKMYQYITPILSKKGINRSLLEVITGNTQAIRSYERSGYKIRRELICYKGEVEITTINKNLEIKVLENYNWELMESFWDISPTWQNSKNVVNDLKAINISHGAYLEGQLVGYIIYNPASKRLQQIAVSKYHRREKIASTLLSKLTEEHNSTLSIINVDKSSIPTNVFFEKTGLKKTLKQFEMELLLDTT